MKKAMLVWMALIISALTSGCASRNVEAQAYAITMGVDEEGGGIRLSIQAPTLGPTGQGEGGQGEAGDYTFASAWGENMASALDMLEASLPRKLNLSGLKSIVVSEALARGDEFDSVLHEMAMNFRVYGAADLIICRGDAGEFVKTQKAIIGARLSESIAVALTHHRESGYIPSAKAADAYYLSHSFYSDPVAVLAAAQGAAEAGEGVQAGSLPRQGDDKSEYFGTALLSGEKMVGELSGRQTQLLNLVRGECGLISWAFSGREAKIVLKGRPSVRVNLEGEAPLISVSLRVQVLNPERDLNWRLLEENLLAGLEEVTSICQACGADPFRYAEAAAGQFLTVEQWRRYGWRTMFPRARVEYGLEMEEVQT